jgi:hypothetical protein
MTGWLLLDSDGTTIAGGRRRRAVPAEIARSLHDLAVVIGPPTWTS